MTLMNRYDEIMAQITVTDEMRTRILAQVLEAAPDARRPARRSSLWRWGAAAACLVLVLTAGFFWRTKQAQQPSPPPVVTGPVSQITQAGSLDELSQLAGFPVEQLPALPFQAEETLYQCYSGTMAQITSTGSGQKAVLRKARGTEDISGDFNHYDHISTFSVGAIEVELRENEGGPSLAIWSDGTYAFSLSLSGTADRETWSSMISGLTH